MTNCRVKAISIIFLLMPVYALAQSLDDPARANELLRNGKTDTATISILMHTGEAFLDRPESKEEDMRMGFRMAEEMEVRSRKTNYQRGIGLSKLLRAKSFRESGRAGEGRADSEEAIRLLSGYGTPTEKAQAILELGGSYSNDDADLPRKIELYEKVIALYKQLGDDLKVANLKEFLGDLYQIKKDYPRALRELNEALSVYKKVGYTRLHGLYSIMAGIYHGSNNFVQSLRYNLMAVETGERLGDRGELMSTIYNRVGLNYYAVRYFDQAIEYFNKALVLAKNNQNTATVTSLLLNIADAYRNKGEYHRSLDSLQVVEKMGNLSKFDRLQVDMISLETYVALNSLDKAAAHFQQLKDFVNNPNEDKDIGQGVRQSVILYLQRAGRFSEADKYTRDYLRNLPLVSMGIRRLAAGEYLAFRTDSAMGRLQSAIGHYQRYKYLSDSITSTNQSRQLDILRLQFQTERKDKDIQLLTQKSKLQEISLQKGRVFRNVVIGSIIMLLLILALLYNRYRLKKQTAFRLEKQQEEINEQNELLKKLVDEKEWLLKEIHHRVKNNLQIIISLLNTQSQYLDNADALAAIKNSQHRMYAMSLIHQRLYHTNNLGAIDMNWYICELIGFMKESFDTGSKISFHVSSEKILLDIVQAIPLGLVLNEAISNAIKYAFTGRKQGAIRVRFYKDQSQYCLLSIADDGVGFPANYSPEASASLGMSLMKGLSDQLEATFDLKSSQAGVMIQIRFLTRSFNNDN